MGLNLFSRRPGWLYKALGLTEPTTPHQLDVDMVRPVLDVFQAGWGLMSWSRLPSFSIPASTAAGSIDLLTADDELTRLVVALNITDNTAAGGEFNLSYRDEVIGTGCRISSWTSTGTPDQGNLVQDFGIDRFLIVPPTFGLRLNHPATGVGESIVVAMARGECPAGFRV